MTSSWVCSECKNSPLLTRRVPASKSSLLDTPTLSISSVFLVSPVSLATSVSMKSANPRLAKPWSSPLLPVLSDLLSSSSLNRRAVESLVLPEARKSASSSRRNSELMSVSTTSPMVTAGRNSQVTSRRPVPRVLTSTSIMLVGGSLDGVLRLINNWARIVACGAISGYNTKPEDQHKYAIQNYGNIVMRRGTYKGFIYFDYVK